MMQSAIEPTTSFPTQAVNLWEKALRLMGDEKLKARLQTAVRTQKKDVLSAVLQTTHEMEQNCIRKRMRFKDLDENEITTCDLFQKMACSINQFKEEGYTELQSDPINASFPWAAIRWLLRTAIDDPQEYGLVTSELEQIARVMAKCHQVEHQFLEQQGPPTQDALAMALVRLYCEILVQLGKMICHYKADALDTATEDGFRPGYGSGMSEIMAQARYIPNLAQLDEAQTLQFLEPTVTRHSHKSLVCWKTLTAENQERLSSWLSPLPLCQTSQDSPTSREPRKLLDNPQIRSWHAKSSSCVLLLQGPAAWCSAAAGNVAEICQATVSPTPFAHVSCTEMTSEPKGSSSDAIMRTILAQLLTYRSDEFMVQELLWAEFERQSALARVKGRDLTRLRSHDCVQLILELSEQDPFTIAITSIDRVKESDRLDLIDSLKDVAAKSGNVAKILVSSIDDGQLFSALARGHLHSSGPSSTLAEDGASLSAACFAGYTETTDEARLGQLQGDISGSTSHTEMDPGPDEISTHIQSETPYQTLTDYEMAVLEATEAGSVARLERLRHSSFYPQLLSDENRERITPTTRRAIQGGHVDVFGWYLRRSSWSSDILSEDAVATAVLYSDLAMIRCLLEKGMSIEAEGQFGSPLVTASLLNRQAIAQVLIQLGADVNAKGTFGSALDIAASKGHNSVVKMLLEAGANLHQEGGPYGTVLQAAAFHGHLETVKLLLGAGAKDNVEGYSKDALHAAIEGGHADIVLLFLEKGYEFRPWKLDEGRCNGYQGGFDKFKDLLRNASPGRAARQRIKYGRGKDKTQVPMAAKPLTDLEAIFKADEQPWTRGQTSVAEPDGHGKLKSFKYINPLDSAVRVGQVNVADLILSQLNALNLNSHTVKKAAVVAVEQGHLPVVELLLKHLALRTSTTECLQSLVDAAQRSRAEGSCGTEDILAIAGRYCSPDELDKLKAKRLTMAQRYEASNGLDYRTVVQDFSAACTYGEIDELAAIVRSRNVGKLKAGQLTQGLQQCAMSGHPSLFSFLLELLLSSGHLDDVADITDDSLVGAAAKGHLDVVKLLVSLREAAPFNVQVIGRALVNACGGGHDYVAQYLIQEMSANVNQLGLDRAIRPPLESPLRPDFWFPYGSSLKPSPDSEASNPTISPLQAAIRGLKPADHHGPFMEYVHSRNRNPQSNPDRIVKMLLDLGANPNDPGAQRMYPIQAAAEYCPDSMVKQLIEAGVDVNLAMGEDSSIFKAAGREQSSGEVLRTLLDAGAKLPIEECAINRLFEKSLSYFDPDPQGRGYGYASRNRGFRLYQTLKDVFEKGPGAAVSTLMALYPQYKASDKRYEHVLQMAAFLDHGALVAMLLSRGVDVNAPGHYYGTALQAAARCGHEDMVRQLLDAGAQINVLQGKWQTALRAAIEGGHERIVRTLLDNGADFRLALKAKESDRDEKVSSCLQLAVRTGKVGIVNALLEAGAVVSDDEATKLAGVRVPVDQPPLVMSAKQGNVAITKALLDSGADVNVRGRQPYSYANFPDEYVSPLSTAISNKHADIVKLLLEHGADVNRTVDRCRSALFLAVRDQDQSLVRLLLKQGANVDYQIWCGNALTEAAEHNHLGIVQDLLSAGTRVDIGQGGWTNPVKRALEMPRRWRTKNFRIAEVLLEALMETQDPGPLIEEALSEAIEAGNSKAMGLILGYLPVTPSRFRQACSAGSEQAVRQMLQRGINPNEADSNGDYPLHVAAAHLQPGIVDTLLEHGADLNAMNRDGKTPLQTALEACAAPRLEFLDPEPARRIPVATNIVETRYSTKWSPGSSDRSPTIEFPTFHRCEQITAKLLDNGASLVPVPGNKAGPPLHAACLIGNKQTVVKLFEQGADVNEIGGHFKHVLFVALVTHRPDLVTLLLEHGADPNYLHEDYGTPLHLASKMGVTPLVKQLLEFGADAAELDANGNVPLEAALKHAQEERRRLVAYDWYSDKALQSLLKEAGGDVQVTEDVLLDAAQSQGPDRLFELLERDESIVISEQIVIAAMTSNHDFVRHRFDKDIDRLMKRTGVLGVTESMLKSAQDYDKIKKLMEFRPLCDITQGLLLSINDARSIKYLLEANKELSVTESLVMHALDRVQDYYIHDGVVVKDKTSDRSINTLLEMLWERNPNLVVTQNMVAAAKSETDLRFVLEHSEPVSVAISEETVSAVLECRSGRCLPMAKLLLEYDPSIRFTPSQALKIAGYPSYVEGLEVMLGHDPTLPIGEDLFLTFFGGMHPDEHRIKLIEVLKRHNRKLVFTQRMRDAVDETYQYDDEKGKREMMYSVREKDVEE